MSNKQQGFINNDVDRSNNGQTVENYEFRDAEHSELTRVLDHFGNKAFLKYQAQGFEQFLILKAYDTEEQNFMKTLSVISKNEIHDNANITNSHCLYKVKKTKME